jgi:hypothetical protein
MFQGLTNDEFIDLIFTSGDRLGMEYTEEAKKRQSIIVPLFVRILQDEENYKYEDQRFWGVVHAVCILGILKDMRSLDGLLAASKFADAYDIEWILDVLPECYFRLGSGVIPKLKESIEEQRSLGSLAIASEVIGLWNLWNAFPDKRQAIEDFFLKVIQIPDTNPAIRTNLIADFAKIGRKDLKGLFVDFYEKGMVDLNIFTRDELETIFAKNNRPSVSYYEIEVFYDPAEIAKRQVIWEEERKKKEQEALEGFILENYNRIGSHEACPCGSGKKFKTCHLPWAEKQLHDLSKNGENRNEAVMKLTSVLAERFYENEIRRFLAQKNKTILFGEIKEEVIQLIHAPMEDFLSGSFSIYFESVFSKIGFDGEEDYKNFMKSFMKYFNAISRQHYNLMT